MVLVFFFRPLLTTFQHCWRHFCHKTGEKKDNTHLMKNCGNIKLLSISYCSKENVVRKTVEFQFLCRLLHLLGYKLQKETGLSLIGDRDVPGDFTPMEWCFLVSDLHVQREASTDGTAVEEDDLAAMVESESLDTLNTIAECLKLVLKYSTYQVNGLFKVEL